MNRFLLHRVGHAWLILLASFIGAASLQAHNDSGYSHNSGPARVLRPDWMAVLPDATRINGISIPGTHDTMARYGGEYLGFSASVVDDMVICQTKSLQDQLHMGIRALDIRCRHVENSFAIHHESFSQHASFGDDVLAVCRNFLVSHPTETIFMRVKEEYEEARNTRQFFQTFEWYQAEYVDAIWHPTNSNDNPMLGEVRGKIVIMKDFSGGGDYGLQWPTSAGDRTGTTDGIQDLYALEMMDSLYPKKWTYVRDHFHRANNGDPNQRFINFLSASWGAEFGWNLVLNPLPLERPVFPYFAASGHWKPGTDAPRLATGLTTLTDPHAYPDFPRVDCFLGICTIAFEGINTLTKTYLNRQGAGRVGMLFADFPGHGLVEAIIQSNSDLFQTGVVKSFVETGTAPLRTVMRDNAVVLFDRMLNNGTVTVTFGNITVDHPVRLTGAGIDGIEIRANQPTRLGR